jgi:hypothetical protein
VGLKQFEASARKQDGRRVVDFFQEGRIARIGDRDHMRVYGLQFLLLVGGVLKSAAAGDGLGDTAGESGGFQFAARGRKDGFGCAKSFYQTVGFARTQAWNGAQGEPVKGIGGRQEA